MEVKIKQGNEMIDTTIEMVDGVMVVSPKVEYAPKDGDVVTNIYNGIYQGTGIFDYEEDTEAWIHVCITKSGVLETDGYLGYVDDLRPATEEEKQKLFNKLAEEGYEFDFEKKQLVKLKWKPKLGDDYWRVDYKFFKFYCDGWTWKNSTYEIDAYNNGYVFRTDEECQAFCDRLNDAINSVKL